MLTCNTVCVPLCSAFAQVVEQAEKQLLERQLAGAENKEYLPIEGLPAFNKVTAQLLFGQDNPLLAQGRVVTVQSLSVSAPGLWMACLQEVCFLYLFGSDPHVTAHSLHPGDRVAAHRRCFHCALPAGKGGLLV